MINAEAMKTPHGSPRGRRQGTDAAQRTQLLAEFDRSGLSASAFARRHRIGYSTFCGWRRRQPKTPTDFVEVELPTAPVELLIELGAQARLRIGSESQIEMAVRLLRLLNAPRPC